MPRKFKVSAHAKQRLVERYDTTAGNKQERMQYDYLKKLSCSKTLCILKDKSAYFILSKTNYKAVTFITEEHANKLLGRGTC